MLVSEAIDMRTGNEPVTARSPLRMRFWLSLWGTLWALFGLVAFLLAGRPGWAAVCAVLLALIITDLGVVVHRLRQGSRYQPGRDVPPYEPGHDRSASGRRPWHGVVHGPR
ncbi:DUF6343 family protein [Streptomyces sp. ADI96-02]|uniref:DUF6343 family protein n=1 Tax=Streptomyces sp. ADI96-02 TaxID=1522760 RepID=UPI0019CF9168|nr:DUF6343 family protein [Streptomyces sp. ADI96-02]